MLDWRKEFEFDCDSAQRITDVIEEHPMSLKHCADILEAVAPICTMLTTGGCLARINEIKCGKWVKTDYKPCIFTKCSECGRRVEMQNKSLFCPNCGAKMSNGKA